MLSLRNFRFYRKTLVKLTLGFFVLGSFVFLPGVFAHRQVSTRTVASNNETAIKTKALEPTLTGRRKTKREKAFVGAANGRAFVLTESLSGIKPDFIKTSKPVFKAFGLTSDDQNLLYSPLKGSAPSGELYIENLATGESRKITSRLVLNAAISPVDDHEIAYTFAGGESFGLATARLDSGEIKTLVPTGVFSEIFQWDETGGGIHYFETPAEMTSFKLAAGYVPVDETLTGDLFRSDLPAGFPALKKFVEPEYEKYEALIYGETGPEIYRFRINAPDARHEVSGDNLLGTSTISALDTITGETVKLGKGQIVKTLESGVVVKEFGASETRLKFVDWKGTGTILSVTPVNYNLPLQNSTMIQGGAGYSSPGNCGLTAHTGTMDFAYDFQSSTVGAHVMAAADGLVVFNTSSMTCNTIDTDSCPDYNAGGCPGSFLGNVLIIQHADGSFSKYAHMQVNSTQAAVGTNVCQGLYIGRQGHTGSTNGTFNGCGDHLHFQLQTSPDLLGQSIAVDFSDVSSNPLSCGLGYNSASTEVAHTISSSAQNFPISGGSGSVNLTSTGCSWSATSNNSWITVTSAANGSGNSLVTFTVANNSGGGPRTGTMTIGGHIFTVSQNGTQPANQAPSANAGLDQTITLPSAATLSGTASDDGLPNPPATLTTTWSKVSGPGNVTFGNANSPATTANFSLAGVYSLRLTANDGALQTSDDLTVIVNVNNGGGLLTGSQTNPAANVNLRNEGTTDWAHWGLTSATSFNHRNNVTQQISNFTSIGSITPLRYNNNPNSFTWTGGTPTASANNTTTGVYVYQLGNGFQLTVPANTTQRTLKLYVGVWAAGGRLEATLSDGSASPLIDKTIISPNVQNGVFTLNYKSASNGQTLTLKWTVDSNTNPAGNITLQAATLTVAAAPTNQSPTVNAGSDQTITLPNAATLSGTASDDGLPNPPAALSTMWSKVSGPGNVTFGNSSALSTTASFTLAGVYVLRLTANDGALQTTDDLTVTVNQPSGGGGSLAASSVVTPASVNLTSEGTTDWAHWGLFSAAGFNHKNGVAQQISNITPLGSGSVQQYGNNPNGYSWTGGTPTASANNTATGIYVIGQNNGFQLTVPADTSPRTFKVYVGLWAAGGRFEASLSDGSAATFVDTSLDNPNGTTNKVYTLNYQAASSGQTLTVKWTVNTMYNQWSNVTLQAAALIGSSAPPTNQPPTVNAGSDQTITLPSAATLSGTASDDGLPNPPATLTTTWSKVSGPGNVAFGNANAPSTTADFSLAGVYVLRLTANDSSLTVSDDVTVTVNPASNGGSGSLAASSIATPANVNLTTEGTADWAHWGLTGASSVNRKNVAPVISNFTVLGSGLIQQYGNNPNGYSWSDGTPAAGISSTPTGVYVIGQNNGFQLTVPADTSPRTFKVYVGLWAAGGRFEASLSDGSAATFVDTTLDNPNGTTNKVYTLNYQAASSGQTLTVKWTVNTMYNQWSNVTLQAAALVGSSTPVSGIGEFQISSSASSAQFITNVTADANGNFLTVWQSSLQDGSGWGIFARRYNAAGVPFGSEFQVNTYTLDNQFVPRAALDSGGNFAIVWESKNQDGSGYGIYCQRYSSSGLPLGSEFRVNTTTLNDQHDPHISMAPNGDFVIVWVSDFQDGNAMGIYGQRFGAAGNPLGGEFKVNTYTTNDQKQPASAMDANGNFVVIWESFGQDGSDKGVYAQRFNAGGAMLGSEFKANTFTANEQSSGWIAMSPTGDFLITWSSALQDGSGFGVYGQRYNAAGAAQGSEFRVNTYTSSDQIYATDTMAPNGNFVIVWESISQDGSGRGIYGQRYNAGGVPQGSEFQINVYTTDNQFNPCITSDINGNFIVAWTSYGQDGSAEGTFGRRFTAAGNPI